MGLCFRNVYGKLTSGSDYIYLLPEIFRFRVTNRRHQRLMTVMSDKALMRASNHFARLGIEIIWADDFNEIPWLLRRLLIKKI